MRIKEINKQEGKKRIYGQIKRIIKAQKRIEEHLNIGLHKYKYNKIYKYKMNNNRLGQKERDKMKKINFG